MIVCPLVFKMNLTGGKVWVLTQKSIVAMFLAAQVTRATIAWLCYRAR